MDKVSDSKPGGLAGLFDAHRAELLRFLRARCGDAADADDLLQELWIRQANAALTGPIANGRAYLFRMANNLVLDTARGTRRAMARDRTWSDDPAHPLQMLEERADPELPADERISRAQEAAVLQEAIATLPPGARRALQLHRIDGLQQGEVARVMGISRSGVEKHLAVAMKNLRKALLDCGWFEPAASNGDKSLRGGEPRVEHGS